MPFIFTGLKYAAGRALLGVVVGELYASTAGLGHMIADAGNMFQTDTLFFGVLIFTATGLVVVALLDRLERRFERWRPSVGSGRHTDANSSGRLFIWRMNGPFSALPASLLFLVSLGRL